jgi:histidinol-phosphate phosphatase family domain/HAD-superfamily hydrolase, subfamily IIIA
MDREYTAIIQAGGMGSRMRELTQDKIPKPMLPLNGKPMIEWQIIQLKAYGIREFVFIVGHLGSRIQDYFGDGSRWNIKIFYTKEEEPLGSAGALYYAKDYIGNKDAILVFGDVMFCLDWNRFITFHEVKNGIVTLLAHPNAHPFDSDLLITNEADQVIGIDAKTNRRDYYYRNCVNAGLSIFKHELLDKMTRAAKTDYESELIKPLITEGCVYAYNTPEYVKDIGTPGRFRAASEEQRQGIWEARCLKNRQRAVFLDRDGTLNVLNGFLCSADDFELIGGTTEAVRKLNSSAYLTIVATNQPVIARGECTLEELGNIHRRLETELGKKGAYVNDIFFCPHHPHRGYEGEIPELKIDCGCRKPKVGMLVQAAEKYNIDLARSWYIGDTTVDLQTGLNAGMHTVLVLTGEAGKDGKYDAVPDYIADTLADAVDYILGQSEDFEAAAL